VNPPCLKTQKIFLVGPRTVYYHIMLFTEKVAMDNKTLEEIIAERIKNNKPVLGRVRVRSMETLVDKPDDEKSLDQIIKERGIENPSKPKLLKEENESHIFKKPFDVKKKNEFKDSDSESDLDSESSGLLVDVALDDVAQAGIKRKRSVGDESEVRKKVYTDILNPCEVLQRLTNNGLVIEFEIGKLVVDEDCKDQRQKTTWRATYKSEAVRCTFFNYF